jgi:phosphate:Na+ symporter
MEMATLIGGLIIFLYAIRRLSKILQNIFTTKAQQIISRYTRNIFSSIFIGIIVTIALDSSSAVIIIAIILINSGSLNFKQVMGIIMGANIGTTFSSQLIALNISKYAVIPLFIGFFIWLFSNSAKIKKVGQIMMYFGLLFFGLYLLELSVSPLKKNELFIKWMLQLNNPLKGAAIGGLVTLIIQSSSATLGMLITFAKQHLIDLYGAIAIMLGAELGTCADTLIAVIGGKRDAIRAGVFHLLFNLIPIIIGLTAFNYFIEFIEWISPKATIHRQIANGHVLFSILSVLLFVPFVNKIYYMIIWLIPDKKKVVKN